MPSDYSPGAVLAAYAVFAVFAVWVVLCSLWRLTRFLARWKVRRRHKPRLEQITRQAALRQLRDVVGRVEARQDSSEGER
jgi:hypothetical protein